MTTILFTAPNMIPLLPRYRTALESLGLELIVPEVHERLSEAEILEYAGQFDGTLCGDDYYTPRALDACAPRLKVISKWGTGIDSIDRQHAESLGIQVRNTPNAFTLPVADSVLGYMLTFARRLPWMDRALKSGHWQKLPGRSSASVPWAWLEWAGSARQSAGVRVPLACRCLATISSPLIRCSFPKTG